MENSLLNLRKDIVLNLSKQHGIENQKAQVVLCIDRSGSMDSMYKDGTVQSVIDRIVPIAMNFDDNQEFELYLFENNCFKHGNNVSLSNYQGIVQRELSKYDMGGTNYAPPIKSIIKDYTGVNVISNVIHEATGFFKKLFGTPKQTTVNITKDNKITPVYVIFITDGENSDHNETRAALIESSKHGIFFQFVGIGRERFSFLSVLENLPGRFIDNANFFKIDNIKTISDNELYEKLLFEFPSWLELAKQNDLIN